MKKLIIALFMLVWGVSVSFAESPARPLKIGCIQLSRIFDEYQHTIDAAKELESLKDEKQKEIDKKVSEIRELKKQLETLSKSDRQAKEAVIDEKVKELKEHNKKIRKEIAQDRDVKVKEILKEIIEFINEYAREKGYDLILNDRMVIYKSPEFDLSNKIIKGLNEQYKKVKKGEKDNS